MPSIQEQTEAVKKMLASAPDAYIYVGAFIISHPDFSATLYGTDYFPGFTGLDHTNVSRDFLYTPLELTLPGPKSDLATELELTISDMNEDGTQYGLNTSIASAIDEISADSAVSPSITLLGYLSYPDGTFSGVVEGPYKLEITDIVFSETGATLTCKSPDAAWAGCGRVYTLNEFPTLKQYM